MADLFFIYTQFIHNFADFSITLYPTNTLKKAVLFSRKRAQTAKNY